MKIHQLQRRVENQKHVLVGRGGKRGKTSGRGGKGQTARAGHKARPVMRDIIKKIPKLRGRGKNSNTSIQTKPVVLNIGALDMVYASGEKVNAKTLVQKGLAEIWGGRLPKIKILGTGDLSKKLMVSGLMVSAEAKTKIEKAGGSVK
jgi:large subunit ribosomal protein L15